MASRRACSRQPIFAASSAVVSQSRSLPLVFSDASALGWDFDAFCGGTTRTLTGLRLSAGCPKMMSKRCGPLRRGGRLFLGLFALGVLVNGSPLLWVVPL